MSGILQAIVVGLAVTLISFVIKLIFAGRQWASRTRGIMIGSLILLLAADTYIVMYLIWRRLPPDIAFPSEGWIILSNGLWFQILLGAILYVYWRRQSGASRSGGYGKEISVLVRREDKDGGIFTKNIRLIWLNHPRGIVDESRTLSAGEFQNGIDILKRQLDQPGYTFHPDFYIGINIGGAVIASYLAGPKGAKKMIGSVMTEGDDHTAYHWVWPADPKDVRQVLIVDSQVKRGKSLKHVYDYVEEYFRQREQNIEIKIAVLAACQVRKAISEITELNVDVHGVFHQDKKYLPEFLAYLSEGIIRLPGNIR